jgi:hypothetical protein
MLRKIPVVIHRIAILIIITTLAFSTGADYGKDSSDSKSKPQGGPPKLKLSETIHDFGDICDE